MEDYSESFAPVVKYTTLRIFLAISAASYNMRVHQLDVESAFIHASLSEVVYMHPHLKCTFHLDTVLNFLGLKQSLRSSEAMFISTTSFIVSIGFKRSELDHCVYIDNFLFSIDDILIPSDSDDALIHVKGMLIRKFKVTLLLLVLYSI
jgi:hypothetical protein